METKPLVSFDGGKIEESDVLQQGAITFYEFRVREEEIKQQIILVMLRDRLLVLEEKTTNKTRNQLMTEFIDKMYDKDTANKIKPFYTGSEPKTADTNQDSPSGEENNELQMKYEAENRYLSTLLKKYNVHFNFTRPQPPLLQVNTSKQPFWGKPDAKIVIIEFGDMECSYCKRMQNDIQKIRSKYGNNIKWVFIDFPLEFHAQAFEAHKAAYCAAEQSPAQTDRYFDFQQLLFQSSPNLDRKTIISLAEAQKLNIPVFETCLMDKSEKKKIQIDRNVEYGKKLGISGTPTIFINGRYYPGLLNFQELEEIIVKEL